MNRLADARQRATRELVLATATALLEAEGAAAVTLNEVARRLAIRPPSLYGYFAGKDDLLQALFLQEATRLWQTLEQLASIERPYERLIANARTYYTWAMTHPWSYQLLFERPLPHFVPSPAGVEMNTRGRLFTQRTLAEYAPDIDTQRAALLLWALLHGACSLQIANTPATGAYDGPFGALARDLIEDVLPDLLQRRVRGGAAANQEGE
jgi:AcrR family transcriptional regulator